MSTDMRLLILTHLRAALERKDWRAVERARLLMTTYDHKMAHALLEAAHEVRWSLVEAVYGAMGGVGSGEPAKPAGGAEKARDGVCEGVAA